MVDIDFPGRSQIRRGDVDLDFLRTGLASLSEVFGVSHPSLPVYVAYLRSRTSRSL